MIDALITGRLYGKPEQRTGKAGKHFTTAKVRVPSEDGETLFCGVIAFDEHVQAGLLALDDGDSVALAGILTPKVFEATNGTVRPGLNLVAHGILTAYHVRRKRRTLPSTPAQNTGDEDNLDLF